jgi:hypothetical protein
MSQVVEVVAYRWREDLEQVAGGCVQNNLHLLALG